MKAYKKLTPKQIAEKGNIGVTLGFPIPKGKELILTDLCGLMQAKNTECVCLLAFSTDGKEEFAISFSAITRWGVENATDDESAYRIGMFENTDYQSTFGNQLRFTGCVIDTNNLQNLFVPKWDKENSVWDFSLLKKRDEAFCHKKYPIFFSACTGWLVQTASEPFTQPFVETLNKPIDT